ncbi:MAG: mechanosensitive ion channel family protein [Dehalococcoidales bacterium]|nr:mechanosensitive ion channel family protein [Dehalococcoidales bacterium]
MWAWFTVNGLWVLIWSIVALIILVIVLHRVEDKIDLADKKKPSLFYQRLRLSLRILIGVCLASVAIAAVAVVGSKEGAAAEVTRQTIEEWFMNHGPYIIAVLAIAYLLYRLARLLMPRMVGGWVGQSGRGRRAREELEKRRQTLSAVLTRWVTVLIVVVAILMVLSELGISVTPVLATAGVAGIVIGFGAQSVVKDLLRGTFIVSQNLYNKGDVVKVAGITGLVEDFSVWRTTMRDLDGIVHTIPSGDITTVSNYTKEWSRVNLNISVAYGEDLDRVTEVINRVAEELAHDATFGPMIIGTPKVLRVDNFGDSGIELKVLGETKPLKQWDVAGELRRRIKKAFDEEGIEIPWPHLKLYFGDTPPPGVSRPSR